MHTVGGKFRKKINFAQVSNVALRDKNLSLKAKGLYSLIQSYITMENFDLYKWYLLNQCKEGEKAFESGWNELKDYGYLKQYRIRIKERDEEGKVLVNNFIYEYELLDEPNMDQPALTNIGLNGKALENKEKIVLPQNGGGTNNEEELYPPKMDGVQNKPCSIGGVSNNTEPKNTKINNIYNQSINQDELSVTEDEIDEIDIKEIIAENIELEIMKDQYGGIYEEAYNLVIDTLNNCDDDFIIIGKNKVPIENAKDRFLKLNQFHIEYVINCVNSASKIKNIRSYLLTCLYNAPTSMNAYYSNQAKNALYEDE